MRYLIKKLRTEKLLLIVFFLFIATTLYTYRIPHYTLEDFKVLLFLYSLMIAVTGIENSGFLEKISQNVNTDKFLGEKLILITGILASIVTNDVALITMVPLTIVIAPPELELVIIFETIAVNGFSSLTPFGNPQNLFIYSFYKPHVFDFIKTIAPLSFTIITVSVIAYSILKVNKKPNINRHLLNYNKTVLCKSTFVINLLLFVVTIMSILRVLPFYFSLFTIIFTLFYDKRNLNIDYSLLLIFFFFFGLTDNLLNIFKISIHTKYSVFIFSSFASQILGNVSSALFFADFTNHWKALLWGVTAGGFGTLFSSFANIISLRIYRRKFPRKESLFLKKFHIISFSFLILSYIVFFILN